jgi:hypothetical protein
MTSRLADIVAEFVTELDDASVTVALGRRELHRNDSPPRVVFERVGGPIEMTRDIGRQDIGSDGTRALWTRSLKLVMHIWGTDEEQAEQLLHNACVAMRRAVGPGNILLGEESWVNDAATGDADLGQEVTVEVNLQVPIVDAMVAIAPAPVEWVGNSVWGGQSGACSGQVHAGVSLPATPGQSSGQVVS